VSRPLAIDSLTFQTKSETVHFDFSAGLNTIVGPVGAGKSSLLELIKYAVGGNALLSKTVEENVRTVEVALRAGNRSLLLSRNIGESQLTVVEDGVATKLTTASANRYERAALYLLDVVGIPRLRVPKARTRPTGKSRPITFFDVFRYCYVSQAEIDTSVVGHTDSTLEPRRRSTFELLFGLTDPEFAQLEVDRGLQREALDEARREAEVVRRFLESSGAPEQPLLRDEEGTLVARITEATETLEGLRVELRAASPQEDVRRSHVAELGEELRGLNVRLVEKRTAMSQRDQLVAQIELEMQRLERGDRAAAVLNEIVYARCPRCLQSVADRPIDAGHCYLCGQPEPDATGSSTDSADDNEAAESANVRAIAETERKRLEDLLYETAELREEDTRDAAVLENQIRVQSLILSQIESEVEQRTREYVSPKFEAIAAASAEIATAHERLRGVREQLAQWERYVELVDGVRARQKRVEELDVAIKNAGVRLASRRGQLTELSETFQEELSRFQPPWLDSARIDPTTYLPVVNEARFETQSAGEKTIINVAYHLALLVHGLRHDETLLPTLLILDGPQSNLGTGPDDRALASRIYTRLVRLADAYPNRFQIIVADNDVPKINDAYPAPIELSYAHPLVPDVEHPGPGVETLYSHA
jgi:DNA repair exonuclease SbcCD ATPase subunit